MTDKEKILAETERLINDLGEQRDINLEDLRDFINSLPEEPKFKVGNVIVSTKNPHLTYKVLQVGLPNELGKLDYEVEIFENGKAGIKVGDKFKEHNIHLISCEKMDEWGKLLLEEPVSEDLQKAARKYFKSLRDYCFIDSDIILAFKTGAQWQKKQFMAKTCDWLKKHAAKYYNQFMFLGTDELIEDFKLVMEWKQ